MKAETKSMLKTVAIVIAAIIGFVGIVWLLPVKVTLTAVFLMQSITLIAVGGTNLRIDNGQKNQKA